MKPKGIYPLFFKPLTDTLLALVMLLVTSPILMLITLLLLVVNRGKPFFLQNRPGKGGRIFKLIKFRTMRDAYDAQGKPLPDKDRLTRTGSFVRSYSLDELPQLINVLKGDMSLVGPRPLLVEYLPLYSKEQARRHGVKPGITGWAQVNGRNAISWAEKFKLDVWYVDHLSLILDVKIILLTIKKVFQRQGINASSQNTMTAFDGNN
jgi:lipopolysaccharide/colanic/teichoic acid biosynthesis glycosyltransferase